MDRDHSVYLASLLTAAYTGDIKCLNQFFREVLILARPYPDDVQGDAMLRIVRAVEYRRIDVKRPELVIRYLKKLLKHTNISYHRREKRRRDLIGELNDSHLLTGGGGIPSRASNDKTWRILLDDQAIRVCYRVVQEQKSQKGFLRAASLRLGITIPELKRRIKKAQSEFNRRIATEEDLD